MSKKDFKKFKTPQILFISLNLFFDRKGSPENKTGPKWDIPCNAID